jgi:formylglycine-generating enzyme
MQGTPLTTFIIYAHDDRAYKEALVKQLKISLIQANKIKLWHDDDIPLGADWHQAIKKNLSDADLVLVLVSTNSLASEYINTTELELTFNRLKQGVVRVVPIILDHCPWEFNTILKGLQGLPEGMKPISDFNNQNEVWTDIVRKLNKLVEQKWEENKTAADALLLEQKKQDEARIKQEQEAKAQKAKETQDAIDKANKAKQDAIDKQRKLDQEKREEQDRLDQEIRDKAAAEKAKIAEANRIANEKLLADAAIERQKEKDADLAAAVLLAQQEAAENEKLRLENLENDRIAQGKAENEAKERQNQLELQRTQRHDRVWEAASAAHTIVGYDDFITDYPNSQHLKEARYRIKQLRQQAVVPVPYVRNALFAALICLLSWFIWDKNYNKPQPIVGLTPAPIVKDTTTKKVPDQKLPNTTLQGGNTPIPAPKQDEKPKNEVKPSEVKPKPTEVPNTPIGKTDPIYPEMVSVKAGTFTMGDANGRSDECPHQVTLDAYKIGKYEVTVGEYLRFCDATNSHYPEWLEKGSSYNVQTGSDSHYKVKGYSRNATDLPIVGVSWKDADAYCKWLSNGYHLPTEEQWEYAAKAAGTENYKYAGSDNLDAIAWHSGNSGSKPHAAHDISKKPNGLGIYHMTGNVWEWCKDPYGPYKGCSVPNPNDTKNSVRVLRGGSWYGYVTYIRVAIRYRYNASIRLNDNGFRLAQD